MSLVGNLEDLGLGEILQIVSLSRKSGVLSLQCDDREGKIFFQDGQVIRANISSRRENLGEVLLRKGLIDLDTLKYALNVQRQEKPNRRLGEILGEQFDISRDAIEAAVKEQVEQIVYSFFTWGAGTFSFELGEPGALGETAFNPLQFMLEQGLNPQWLAMEGSRQLDERMHRGEPLEDEPEGEPIFDVDEFLGTEGGGQPTGDNQASKATESSGSELQAGDIYLIDDDHRIRTVLAETLERLGQGVRVFDDAEEYLYGVAAAVGGGENPALLVDLIMPRKDGNGMLGGVELLEQILGRYPALPVVVMSDHPNSDADHRLRQLGVRQVIEKPKKSSLQKDDGEAVERLAKRAMELFYGPQQSAATETENRLAFNLGAELRREFGEQDISPEKKMPSPGLHLLRDMLVELQNPSLGGGIILLVLRFASELMNRAVVFAVKDTEIIGLGQFGITAQGENADSRIRRMRFPCEDASVIKSLVQAKTPMKVSLGKSEVDNYLQEQLGGGKPQEVFLGPILSEGKVVAILYGDNLPEKSEIGDTESLEIFLSQAGLAMEKAILERRLRSSRDY